MHFYNWVFCYSWTSSMRAKRKWIKNIPGGLQFSRIFFTQMEKHVQWPFFYLSWMTGKAPHSSWQRLHSYWSGLICVCPGYHGHSRVPWMGTNTPSRSFVHMPLSSLPSRTSLLSFFKENNNKRKSPTFAWNYKGQFLEEEVSKRRRAAVSCSHKVGQKQVETETSAVHVRSAENPSVQQLLLSAHPLVPALPPDVLGRTAEKFHPLW